VQGEVDPTEKFQSVLRRLDSFTLSVAGIQTEATLVKSFACVWEVCFSWHQWHEEGILAANQPKDYFFHVQLRQLEMEPVENVDKKVNKIFFD